MFSILRRFQRTRAILAVFGIAGGLAVWYYAARLPPIPQRPLRIGFEQNPPLQYHTADGLAGLGVEAVSEAARRAGLPLQWVETKVSSEESFRKGLVDLWPVMADLPYRQKSVHFSRPWLHSSHALLVRSGAPTPGHGFTGRIAVFKLPLHVRMAHERFPAAQLVQLPDAVAVLKEVCSGTAAAGFLEFRTALNTLQAKPPECATVPIRTQILPALSNQLSVASTFEAAGAAERLRDEIGGMFRDGTMALIMAKYPYYGLDDTWAAYDSIESAERTRWLAGVVIALTIALALIVWRVASARQRKRSEAALRESEERFRNMADNAPVMIWVTGPDKLFTFVNKTWLSFTGRTMEQELGVGWAEGVYCEDQQRCYETFSSAFDARRNFQLECRLRRYDGEYRTILCSGVPRFAPGGVFAGYIGSDSDITDLQSEERFRELAENIDEVFWMLDLRTNRVLYVSPAFERVWGSSAAALYRDRDWLVETVHPEDRERFVAFLEKVRSEREEVSYRIVRPDGSVRWIQDRGFRVCDGEGKPYRVAGIAEDITDRRELEEQLRQAQKMEAVGRLAGGVAHDFNNLLTIIGGYAKMLLDSSHPQDPWREKLEQILNAANRAGGLTRQLLAFSRRQVLQPELVNVNHLLTHMEALLRRLIGEDIAVETALDPDVSCIKVDPHQLEQIVMNLAANARDAMPNGGQFRIQTSMASAAAVAEGDRQNSDGTCVRLRISDTGCGMDNRTLERAFEPFFTTKGMGKGTGLGLSTVYGAVRQNQGRIEVSSEPGQGTVFDIYFPAVPESEARSEFPTDPPRKAKATETVLVAEDEPAVRGLVRQTLMQLGYTVLEAADGHEALRIAEQHQSEIHLLLADVIMPLMNGRDLAERLTSIRQDTRILYMSGYTDDMLAFHGIDQPDISFIQKPFTPSELAEKVAAVLSAGRNDGE